MESVLNRDRYSQRKSGYPLFYFSVCLSSVCVYVLFLSEGEVSKLYKGQERENVASPHSTFI